MDATIYGLPCGWASYIAMLTSTEGRLKHGHNNVKMFNKLDDSRIPRPYAIDAPVTRDNDDGYEVTTAIRRRMFHEYPIITWSVITVR